MKRKINFYLLLLFVFPLLISAQDQEFYQNLYDSYDEFKEEAITQRRFKHEDIQPLIDEYAKISGFKVKKVGESIEGRDLRLISIGSGETDVFLWSQMHGDESTATMALFDIFNFFVSDKFSEEKEEILNNVTVHFLPMLNPDGAEVFSRRNALGIDVNRDAKRLRSPEARTLKRIRDSLDADFGFNLHDQSRYYNTKGSQNPATISFLAPAYNYEKDVNEVRGNAMRLIVEMNEILQQYAPGHVGRYNDDFEPRAFGDNIQKWGTSTILIESGGYPDDREKQVIRKLNFVAILSALCSIANENYLNFDISEYEEIPNNESKLYDLIIAGLDYDLRGEDYNIDLGINLAEVDNETHDSFYYRGRVVDQGDLSTNYAYKTIDASGYRLKPAKVYPESFDSMADLEKVDFDSLLADGFAYVKVKNIADKNYSPYPVHIVSENFEVPQGINLGANPTFFLEKNGSIDYAVVNGFVAPVKNASQEVENALIFQ